MATCKECLHIDVCYMVEHYGVDIEEDGQEYDCHQFKDKANYEEVKHGRWKGAGMGDYYCSVCQQLVNPRTNYCPKCGAIMDLGDKQ